MNHEQLLASLQQLKKAKVLVIGDLILDKYTYGDAERVSQESPVIVLRADKQESRLGGAANVCNMLRGLDCDVVAVGVVGDDAAGTETVELLQESGIETRLVMTDDSRPTTVKERFVGRAGARHPSQILRVDHEKTDLLSAEIERELTYKTLSMLDQCDVVLVSDYAKGVCTPNFLRIILRAAKTAGLPVLVDPMRGHDYERYRGASLIKANRIETEMATGLKLNSPEDATAAGLALCEQLDVESVIVTLDSDGMALVNSSGTTSHFPTEARSVYDITGAGDMVLAMLGACLGSGLSKENAVRLANVAAGLEVEKSGVVVIPLAEIEAELTNKHQPGNKKIVTQDQITRIAEEHRRRGQKIVFTNGCFDLLHFGHVTNLNQSSQMGDLLVIGLNSDRSVSDLKGPQRPIISENERAAMLAALSCVAYVVIFDEETPYDLIAAVRPDILVKGGHYVKEEIPGYDILQSYGGEVRLVDIVDGFSTTEIINKVSVSEPIRLKIA
ncbi:MAG: D-glycero-beta-D-manno-heptose 1-phosphate adenylyltransferase [Blastopirellula sp.]|nr:MAG: D-glycero-beta-D-manno-heptose 1-phosphate adenylyltransferase [Blastopirellula sp.]